jgi:hypothetical protein
MKKMFFAVLAVVSLMLVSSCGKTSIYSNYTVKDKDAKVVGYSDGTYLQDLEGNWLRFDFLTGKIRRESALYFSNANCTGTAYIGLNFSSLNYIYKTYPYMYGDNSTNPADSTASDFFYKVTSIALGTENVKSYLVLDTTYTTDYSYNPNDSNTWKYTCVTVADTATNAGVDYGQCKAAGTQQIICTDTVGTFQGLPCEVTCTTQSGDFTQYPANEYVPLQDSTYTQNWGVLTDVSAEAANGSIIIDYSDKAPLELVSFN